jgi:hypothetical protein
MRIKKDVNEYEIIKKLYQNLHVRNKGYIFG